MKLRSEQDLITFNQIQQQFRYNFDQDLTTF
jgi:hypothetical protein